MRASLGRLFRRVSLTTTVEVAGLTSIAGGIWMVFPPAALVVTGLALIAWVEGHRG